MVVVSRVVRGRGNWLPVLPPWCWLYDGVWRITCVRVILHGLWSPRRYMRKKKIVTSSHDLQVVETSYIFLLHVPLRAPYIVAVIPKPRICFLLITEKKTKSKKLQL